MANLSYGSSGDEVKKLQEQLNKNGYNLDTDGIFGSKTQAAVRDYQSKNGLTVDGIVGVNTSGKLYGSSTSSSTTSSSSTSSTSSSVPTAPTVAAAPTAPTTTARPTYTQSDALKSASDAVTNWENSKPSDYSSNYQSQIDSLLDSVINGKKFSYNVNEDALYNQYKDKYTQLGQKAMQDTIGQSAAMTGGYGSSYATTAGSQAYQDYLTQLNDVVPELQDAAYQRYLNEQDTNRNNLSTLQGLEEQDYSRYRDTLSDYYTEGDYLTNKAEVMSEDEWNKYIQTVEGYESDRDYTYNQYLTDVEKYNADRDYDYNQYLSQLDQYNTDRDFNYQKTQDAISQSNWEKEYALEKSSLLSSGSSSSGSSSSGSSSSSSSSSGYSATGIKNMIANGNMSGAISALSGSFSSTDDLINQLTSYGADYDEAKTAVYDAYMPKTYSEFVALTGQSGIYTEDEFRSRGTAKKKYGTYQAYLEEMVKQYE